MGMSDKEVTEKTIALHNAITKVINEHTMCGPDVAVTREYIFDVMDISVAALVRQLAPMLKKAGPQYTAAAVAKLFEFMNVRADVQMVNGTVKQPDPTQPRMRSGARPRTEQRSDVIAHTLTDTEWRYGQRVKDAQLVRDLYRGQGHKRVDVYSPMGDLLQTVDVEP